jgi:Cof subfamily protein (haloacid dehalogenase superfamily)
MTEPLPNWETHDVESLREFSRICLIAADLDGTFLESKGHQLSETLVNLRRYLSHKRYDVALTIATGRALAGVRPILLKLQLPPRIPLILYNGSVIIRNKSMDAILRRTIKSSVLQRVLSVSEQFPARTYAYVFEQQNGDNFRMIEDIEHVLGWSRHGRPRFEFNGLQVDWQTSYIPSVDANPSAIIIEATSDARILASIEELLSDIKGINTTRSSISFIEIRPVGSNKGTALAVAAEDLGLNRENLLALGDNDNDVEMLSWAGIGVSIAGASRAAIDASDYVCRHGVMQGAVEVLRLVKHARRYFFQPEQKMVKVNR